MALPRRSVNVLVILFVAQVTFGACVITVQEGRSASGGETLLNNTTFPAIQLSLFIGPSDFHLIDAPLIVGNPRSGCLPLQLVNVTGKVVILQGQAGCSWETKARNMQQLGATAVIWAEQRYPLSIVGTYVFSREESKLASSDIQIPLIHTDITFASAVIDRLLSSSDSSDSSSSSGQDGGNGTYPAKLFVSASPDVNPWKIARESTLWQFTFRYFLASWSCINCLFSLYFIRAFYKINKKFNWKSLSNWVLLFEALASLERGFYLAAEYVFSTGVLTWKWNHFFASNHIALGMIASTFTLFFWAGLVTMTKWHEHPIWRHRWKIISATAMIFLADVCLSIIRGLYLTESDAMLILSGSLEGTIIAIVGSIFVHNGRQVVFKLRGPRHTSRHSNNVSITAVRVSTLHIKRDRSFHTIPAINSPTLAASAVVFNANVNVNADANTAAPASPAAPTAIDSKVVRATNAAKEPPIHMTDSPDPFKTGSNNNTAINNNGGEIDGSSTKGPSSSIHLVRFGSSGSPSLVTASESFELPPQARSPPPEKTTPVPKRASFAAITKTTPAATTTTTTATTAATTTNDTPSGSPTLGSSPSLDDKRRSTSFASPDLTFLRRTSTFNQSQHGHEKVADRIQRWLFIAGCGMILQCLGMSMAVIYTFFWWPPGFFTIWLLVNVGACCTSSAQIHAFQFSIRAAKRAAKS